MSTPNQKRLKTLTLSYLDKLIAYVEELKEHSAPTSLDHMLKLQRQRVNNTTDPDVLLQVSDGDELSKYLQRVDSLEDSIDDDGVDPRDSQARTRKGEQLDDYLVKLGGDIDNVRDRVREEAQEFAQASYDSGNPFLDAVADQLAAAGVEVSLVTAFRKKTFSELLAARKKRRRWARTPAGKAALRREKIRAKRPHVIDRNRSKVSKKAHQVYHY